MKFRPNRTVLTAVFATFLCGTAASRAYAQVPINETITVHAVQKTDAKSHPANVEGTFAHAPDRNKDDYIDVDNPGVVFKGAGVCDVVDDQVMLRNVAPPAGISVRILVIGREGGWRYILDSSSAERWQRRWAGASRRPKPLGGCKGLFGDAGTHLDGLGERAKGFDL
jgi:hypothetical protein